MATLRPGGELASRPLHFFWIVDTSGSMSGDKIQIVNTAIREAIPEMRRVAAENVNAQVLVRVLGFSSGVQWQVPAPVPVDQFTWTDLSARGVTDMGAAMKAIAEQLKVPPMNERALPPVLVLLSDGQPTDDYSAGLQELLDLPWGKKAVRVAIAIGKDCDREVLQKFIAHPEMQPLEANNPEALVKCIKWASTVVLQSASAPPSQPQGGAPMTGNLPPSLVSAQPAPTSAADVW
jgi:uncharacterized protein YegL